MNHRLLLIVPLALSVSAATSLQAQRHGRHRDSNHDGNWLDRCRNNDGDGNRARFCEERAMGWPSSAGSNLVVDASPNGGVAVTGWDRDSIDVIVRIQTQAGSDEDARQLAQQIRISNDHGTISADGPSIRGRTSWSVSFEIRAPKRTNLNLTTINGPLAVEEVSGTIRLRAENGPITLDRLGGDVSAHAQNGPLRVELTGARWDGAGLDASTQNGPLVVDVPEGYNANFETGTVNGPMELGFPIMVQGRIGAGSNRRIRATLGSGGPSVRVVTTNGPAIIRRS